MITVVLADDHEVVRSGFKMILERSAGFQVVGEAADGIEAFALVQRKRPDVVLLDISMPPGQSGLTACREITGSFPDTKVIILTMFSEPEYLFYTLRGNAAGYLLKSASPNELVCAVRTVCAGSFYIDPSMAEVYRDYIEKNGSVDMRQVECLTPRELEVLRLLAKGFTNREVADQLFISVKTVEAHRSKIHARLNLKTRAELVDFALKHKLVEI